LLALLPLIARSLPGGQAGTFTVLLASMGAGAIFAALQMPLIRKLMPLQSMIRLGTALQATAAVVVAFAPNIYVAVPGMLLAGVAWISVANSLTVAAQMALPDWVRARGMSIYQMALMGSSATGAALWGLVATWTNIHESVAIAAVSSVCLMLVAQRLVTDRGIEEDLTPSRVFKVPQADAPPQAQRIQVNIEYRIDPARAEEFLQLMQESRRSRISQGAIDWQVLQDLYDPGRIVEQVTDLSWTEHLRRFDRVTAADVQLRDRKLAFHIAEHPPVVTRFVIEG
jgi:MFS family permease